MKAHEIAAKAAELVGGDREKQHGKKLDNFSRIAGLWQGWLDIRKPGAIGPHDVGVMMTLLKLARTQSGSFNIDDYIDATGYSACAGEVAHELSKTEEATAGSVAEVERLHPAGTCDICDQRRARTAEANAIDGR